MAPHAQAKIDLTAGAMSNYIWRGISQTQNDPSANAGITYSHDSGLYIGNWNSNVSKAMYTKGYGLEVDIFGGYKKEFRHVHVDAGLYGMLYPGAKIPGPGGAKYDTYEFYGAVEIGPLKLQLNQAVSKYFGVQGSKRTRYYQSELNIPIVQWSRVNLHVNYVDSPLGRNYSYRENKAGLVFSVLGGDLSLHYCQNQLNTAGKIMNTLKGEKLYKNTLVATYGYTKTF